MSKQTARQRKQDRMKRIVMSAIALLLVAVLVAGLVTMAVHAAESDTLNITVTDGTNPIPGAFVSIEQTSDAAADQPEETVPTLLKTLTLNSSDHWEVGFFKTYNSSQGSHYGQPISPSSNPKKIYRTGLIPVEGSDYIYIDTPTHPVSGYAYKWKIHWYGTTAEPNGTTASTVDFISYATEQSEEFSFHNQFAVPEGACYVRIAIASIKGTTLSASAESTFDADAFYAAGGLTVKLYRNEGTVLNTTINSTGVLEVGTYNNSTGATEANDLYSRTNAPFSTEGASMLAVNFPAHPNAASGSYYKWKVMFYNNNTFVGLAPEVTEPDTKVYFDVPSGANEYKIVFAAVENGATAAVDLESFCESGGFSVTLYGATSTNSASWITDSGMTDENGQITFSVPAGANYKYTVSATNYTTATKTVTPAEYASGVNVVLEYDESNVDYNDILDITVNNGTNPIPSATVKVEQILDPSLIRPGTVTVEKVGTIAKKGSSCQGGAIYGKYFVQVDKGISGSPYTVWFHLFDLETNTHVTSVSMAGDKFNGSYSQYKNNNANFGTTFYDENDPFPLLYVSSAYDYRTVVVRIYQEEGTWKAKQVQIIDYSSEMHNNDGFYSCNVLLDNENGFMYLTPINATYTSSSCTKQWFYKFAMPEFVENSVVTITPDMALEERIEVAYEFAPQGACIWEGKVYQSFGYSGAEHPGKIGVFDLATKTYDAKINIYDMGFHVEPESCGFYNGSLYFVSSTAGVYKMTPNAYIPSGDSNASLDDTVINTVVLNKDADWEAGFLKAPSSGTGTYLGQEIKPNSKIFRSGLIDIGEADYINIPTPTHSTPGYAYKWKIHWYGPDAQLGATTEAAIDFIGYAAEQGDFDFTNKFVVPTGAKYVRICVASIKGTTLTATAESTFPESQFLSDGGLTVQMYDEGQVVQRSSLWLDESGTTNASGKVAFYDIVPGASFRITVSADGYKTVSKTIFGKDYLEGLTVTLQSASQEKLGDADGDGHADAYDASLIKKYSVGAITESDLNLSVLDLDGDSHVDAYDASLIQKFSVGAIDKFPVE